METDKFSNFKKPKKQTILDGEKEKLLKENKEAVGRQESDKNKSFQNTAKTKLMESSKDFVAKTAQQETILDEETDDSPKGNDKVVEESAVRKKRKISNPEPVGNDSYKKIEEESSDKTSNRKMSSQENINEKSKNLPGSESMKINNATQKKTQKKLKSSKLDNKTNDATKPPKATKGDDDSEKTKTDISEDECNPDDDMIRIKYNPNRKHEDYLKDLKSHHKNCRKEDEEIRSQFVLIPMKGLIDSTTDRPELEVMGDKRYLYGGQDITRHELAYVFYIQYLPCTYCSKFVDGIVNCLKKRFDGTGNEYEIMNGVLNDKNTQALSIGFRDEDSKTGCQPFIVISTIVFRIVWDNKSKDQFLFIYYRATDERSLSERQTNKNGFLSDYKKKMENHGFGRYLVILAQQLLRKISQDACSTNASQRIYLLANEGKACEFYTKGLGFSVVGKMDKNDSHNINKNASNELKECLHLERAIGTDLLLLRRNEKVAVDTVSFGRKINKTLKVTIQKVILKHYAKEETLVTKLMRQNYSASLEKIDDDEIADYLERYKSNKNESNPFEFMLPDVHQHSRMHIKDIIEELDNENSMNNNALENDLTAGLFDDEISEGEDEDESNEKEENEKEPEKNKKEDKLPQMELSYVDRQFMSMFALEVVFDGKVDKNKYVECEKGNIYCKACGMKILNQDISFQKLIKYGANIMQHHLLDDISYLGFASSQSSDRFKNTLEIDKTSIIKCVGTKDRASLQKLFVSISADSQMTTKEATNKAKSAIVFMQFLLRHFYEAEFSLYVQYIKKGLRRFGEAMERIRIDALRENRKKRKNKDKELEITLEIYRKMFYDRQFGLTYAQREANLLQAITTNPDKKPVKKRKKIMFHGVDVSIFDTPPERTKFRNKMRDEELKINWHTMERVNRETRDENQKLPDECKNEKRSVFWLGTSTVFGKETDFLITYVLIPKNWETEKGHLFSPQYLQSIPDNTPTEVSPDIRQILKDELKKIKTSNLQNIRLKINPITKEKSWEVQTTNKVTYKNLIDITFLKDNYEKDEPEYYERLCTIPDVWHELPSGARRTTANLPKSEEDEDIEIYIPNAYKCAFANMANALYELQDFEVADFFVSHLNSDYETITSFIHNDGGKGTKSQFMIAILILQHKFKYKVTTLKENDTLLTPPEKGQFKFVTVCGGYDDYKHVISIVQNRIFDSSNKKILTLCEESVAWCCSKTVKELKASGKTIDSGYLVTPPVKNHNYFKKFNFKKRQFKAIQNKSESDENESNAKKMRKEE